MRVVVVHHDPETSSRWREALSKELPEATVEIWGEARGDDASYAIGWGAPPAEFLAQQTRLKAFFSTGAGVEKILASAALPPELPILRLEDAGMGVQMADYCLYEVIRWMRRREQYSQQQRARTWQQLPADDAADWPIGIFGMGVLGKQVAAAFASLGFPVNGYSRSSQSGDGRITSYAESGGAGEFAAFMRATRVLVIMAPLTPATQDRFHHASLALLQPSSYVINVARGGLLVEEALLELLDSGHIAGAALDVFREEPLPAQHPFWSQPNVSITPHISAITIIGPSAQQVAQKIRKLESGEPVSGLVDRARGY